MVLSIYAGDTEEETALTFPPHLFLVGVKICMEVLLVRLAGGSASFCRLGQGGLDAKCDRAGVLQALWAVPSTLEGKTRRKHSNSQTEWQKWCAGRATRSTNDFKIMLKLSLSKSLRHLLVGARGYTLCEEMPQRMHNLVHKTKG